MGDTAAIVAGLRRQWGLGLVLLGVGVPLAFLTGGLGLLPALVLLPVAAGRTVARAEVVPASWLVLAVLVPALPVLAAVGAVVGTFTLWGQPLLLFVVALPFGMLAAVAVGAVVGTFTIWGQPLLLFVVALPFGMVAAVVLAVLLVAWGIEVGRLRRSSVRRPHARVEE